MAFDEPFKALPSLDDGAVDMALISWCAIPIRLISIRRRLISVASSKLRPISTKLLVVCNCDPCFRVEEMDV